nr:hypothetical protein [Ruminococcus sp.]
IIYNGITTIKDKGLEEISGGATKIPDLLMKNIKYVPGIDSLLSTSEKLGKVKDCYFIQETLKNLCSKEFFEETQNEYYNVRFILQSSLTAYELLLDSGAVIKPDDKQFIEQKCNKISDMISNLKTCNINFYSTNMVSNNLKNLNELFIHNNSNEKSTTTTSTEPNPQITAIDLIDKSIPEIISLMNGEYQIIQTEMGGYYNGTYSGIFYIQNQSVFPGMEFYVETLLNESVDFKGGQSIGKEIQSKGLRKKLEAGKYALDAIQVNKSGKATDSISADMDYVECSKALDNFDCIEGNGGYIGGSPLSALYTYNEKNAKIELHFIATSEMFNAFRLSENNKLSSEQMKSFNPSIMNVVIRKTNEPEQTVLPTESTSEEITNNFDISDYNGMFYPNDSNVHAYVDIQSKSEKYADIEVNISNTNATHISQVFFSGNIDSNTLTFENEDEYRLYGKNSYTLEFKDGKVYLTSKCIKQGHILDIPELNKVELTLLSEEDKLKLIMSSYGNICAWEYADYDGNGMKEAFAIVGKNSMPDYYISDSIQGVYFISAKGDVKELSKVSNGLMCSKEHCTEYSGKKFFSYNATAGGSGSQTYLFSVKNGNCYELSISGTIVDFYNDSSKCYATISEFLPEGGHIWAEYALIYDKSSQEFSIGNDTGNIF